MAWEHPHGNGANNSFADVNTAPAGAGLLSVPGLGSFAPGAGPVIAPDGTVYLGTTEGRLIALRADGGELWAAQLPSLQGIVSSPVIGTDGSIYVVGLSLPVRDHREGSVVTVYQAWLHKFAQTGERLWDAPFPAQRNRALPYYGPRLTGAPNIWRLGAEEYAIVPVVYRSFGREYHVVAFPARGGTPVSRRVSYIPDSVTGGSDWNWWNWWEVPFDHGVEVDPIALPGLPPVAVYTLPGGGTPWIMASDRVHDTVGMTFDPAQGFYEHVRVRDANRAMLSAPSALPDSHTTVGTNSGEVVFVGPSQIVIPPVNAFGGTTDPEYAPRIFASLTLTADPSLAVVVGLDGQYALLRRNTVEYRTRLGGPSVVPAAASRTNVFVSTDNALVTFNSDVTSELRRFPWLGGGTSPPAIGPSGRVYAIASNILFIFPPPRQRPRPEGPVGGDRPPPINPG
ncbi:MAG: hypothetical protein JNM75_00795 [Rhodospirillales bacterium]|nr:hypothetical protein [Rhodospirillales bacterium]